MKTPKLALGLVLMTTFIFVLSMNVQAQDINKTEMTNLLDMPDPQESGGYVNVSLDVTDDVAVDEVWLNITLPNTSTTNMSMIPGTGDQWYLNATYSQLGVHTYTVWANDSSDNWNSTLSTFTIQDTIPPTLTSLLDTPDPQEYAGFVNVTVDVTDSVQINAAFLNITHPNSSTTNITMIQGAGDEWFLNTTYNQLGVHSYTVWANDTSNNFNSVSSTFTIQDTTLPIITSVLASPDSQEIDGFVNITADVTDTYLDAIYINMTLPSTSTTNTSMNLLTGDTWYLNNSYSGIGIYTFIIWANDTNGNENTSGPHSFTIINPLIINQEEFNYTDTTTSEENTTYIVTNMTITDSNVTMNNVTIISTSFDIIDSTMSFNKGSINTITLLVDPSTIWFNDTTINANETIYLDSDIVHNNVIINGEYLNITNSVVYFYQSTINVTNIRFVTQDLYFIDSILNYTTFILSDSSTTVKNLHFINCTFNPLGPISTTEFTNTRYITWLFEDNTIENISTSFLTLDANNSMSLNGLTEITLIFSNNTVDNITGTDFIRLTGILFTSPREISIDNNTVNNCDGNTFMHMDGSNGTHTFLFENNVFTNCSAKIFQKDYGSVQSPVMRYNQFLNQTNYLHYGSLGGGGHEPIIYNNTFEGTGNVFYNSGKYIVYNNTITTTGSLFKNTGISKSMFDGRIYNNDFTGSYVFDIGGAGLTYGHPAIVHNNTFNLTIGYFFYGNHDMEHYDNTFVNAPYVFYPSGSDSSNVPIISKRNIYQNVGMIIKGSLSISRVDFLFEDEDHNNILFCSDPPGTGMWGYSTLTLRNVSNIGDCYIKQKFIIVMEDMTSGPDFFFDGFSPAGQEPEIYLTDQTISFNTTFSAPDGEVELFLEGDVTIFNSNLELTIMDFENAGEVNIEGNCYIDVPLFEIDDVIIYYDNVVIDGDDLNIINGSIAYFNNSNLITTNLNIDSSIAWVNDTILDLTTVTYTNSDVYHGTVTFLQGTFNILSKSYAFFAEASTALFLSINVNDSIIDMNLAGEEINVGDAVYENSTLLLTDTIFIGNDIDIIDGTLSVDGGYFNVSSLFIDPSTAWFNNTLINNNETIYDASVIYHNNVTFNSIWLNITSGSTIYFNDSTINVDYLNISGSTVYFLRSTLATNYTIVLDNAFFEMQGPTSTYHTNVGNQSGWNSLNTTSSTVIINDTAITLGTSIITGTFFMDLFDSDMTLTNLTLLNIYSTGTFYTTMNYTSELEYAYNSNEAYSTDVFRVINDNEFYAPTLDIHDNPFLRSFGSILICEENCFNITIHNNTINNIGWTDSVILLDNIYGKFSNNVIADNDILNLGGASGVIKAATSHSESGNNIIKYNTFYDDTVMRKSNVSFEMHHNEFDGVKNVFLPINGGNTRVQIFHNNTYTSVTSAVMLLEDSSPIGFGKKITFRDEDFNGADIIDSFSAQNDDTIWIMLDGVTNGGNLELFRGGELWIINSEINNIIINNIAGPTPFTLYIGQGTTVNDIWMDAPDVNKFIAPLDSTFDLSGRTFLNTGLKIITDLAYDNATHVFGGLLLVDNGRSLSYDNMTVSFGSGDMVHPTLYMINSQINITDLEIDWGTWIAIDTILNMTTYGSQFDGPDINFLRVDINPGSSTIVGPGSPGSPGVLQDNVTYTQFFHEDFEGGNPGDPVDAEPTSQWDFANHGSGLFDHLKYANTLPISGQFGEWNTGIGALGNVYQEVMPILAQRIKTEFYFKAAMSSAVTDRVLRYLDLGASPADALNVGFSTQTGGTLSFGLKTETDSFTVSDIPMMSENVWTLITIEIDLFNSQVRMYADGIPATFGGSEWFSWTGNSGTLTDVGLGPVVTPASWNNMAIDEFKMYNGVMNGVNNYTVKIDTGGFNIVDSDSLGRDHFGFWYALVIDTDDVLLYKSLSNSNTPLFGTPTTIYSPVGVPGQIVSPIFGIAPSNGIQAKLLIPFGGSFDGIHIAFTMGDVGSYGSNFLIHSWLVEAGDPTLDITNPLSWTNSVIFDSGLDGRSPSTISMTIDSIITGDIVFAVNWYDLSFLGPEGCSSPACFGIYDSGGFPLGGQAVMNSDTSPFAFVDIKIIYQDSTGTGFLVVIDINGNVFMMRTDGFDIYDYSDNLFSFPLTAPATPGSLGSLLPIALSNFDFDWARDLTDFNGQESAFGSRSADFIVDVYVSGNIAPGSATIPNLPSEFSINSTGDLYINSLNDGASQWIIKEAVTDTVLATIPIASGTLSILLSGRVEFSTLQHDQNVPASDIQAVLYAIDNVTNNDIYLTVFDFTNNLNGLQALLGGTPGVPGSLIIIPSNASAFYEFDGDVTFNTVNITGTNINMLFRGTINLINSIIDYHTLDLIEGDLTTSGMDLNLIELDIQNSDIDLSLGTFNLTYLNSSHFVPAPTSLLLWEEGHDTGPNGVPITSGNTNWTTIVGSPLFDTFALNGLSAEMSLADELVLSFTTKTSGTYMISLQAYIGSSIGGGISLAKAWDTFGVTDWRVLISAGNPGFHTVQIQGSGGVTRAYVDAIAHNTWNTFNLSFSLDTSIMEVSINDVDMLPAAIHTLPFVGAFSVGPTAFAADYYIDSVELYQLNYIPFIPDNVINLTDIIANIDQLSLDSSDAHWSNIDLISTSIEIIDSHMEYIGGSIVFADSFLIDPSTVYYNSTTITGPELIILDSTVYINDTVIDVGYINATNSTIYITNSTINNLISFNAYNYTDIFIIDNTYNNVKTVFNGGNWTASLVFTDNIVNGDDTSAFMILTNENNTSTFNLVLSNNEIYDFDYGLSIVGSFFNNTFDNNTISGVNNVFIEMIDMTSRFSENVFDNNTIAGTFIHAKTTHLLSNANIFKFNDFTGGTVFFETNVSFEAYGNTFDVYYIFRAINGLNVRYYTFHDNIYNGIADGRTILYLTSPLAIGKRITFQDEDFGNYDLIDDEGTAPTDTVWIKIINCIGGDALLLRGGSIWLTDSILGTFEMSTTASVSIHVDNTVVDFNLNLPNGQLVLDGPFSFSGHTQLLLDAITIPTGQDITIDNATITVNNLNIELGSDLRIDNATIIANTLYSLGNSLEIISTVFNVTNLVLIQTDLTVTKSKINMSTLDTTNTETNIRHTIINAGSGPVFIPGSPGSPGGSPAAPFDVLVDTDIYRIKRIASTGRDQYGYWYVLAYSTTDALLLYKSVNPQDTLEDSDFILPGTVIYSSTFPPGQIINDPSMGILKAPYGQMIIVDAPGSPVVGIHISVLTDTMLAYIHIDHLNIDDPLNWAYSPILGGSAPLQVALGTISAFDMEIDDDLPAPIFLVTFLNVGGFPTCPLFSKCVTIMSVFGTDLFSGFLVSTGGTIEDVNIEPLGFFTYMTTIIDNSQLYFGFFDALVGVWTDFTTGLALPVQPIVVSDLILYGPILFPGLLEFNGIELFENNSYVYMSILETATLERFAYAMAVPPDTYTIIPNILGSIDRISYSTLDDGRVVVYMSDVTTGEIEWAFMADDATLSTFYDNVTSDPFESTSAVAVSASTGASVFGGFPYIAYIEDPGFGSSSIRIHAYNITGTIPPSPGTWEDQYDDSNAFYEFDRGAFFLNVTGQGNGTHYWFKFDGTITDSFFDVAGLNASYIDLIMTNTNFTANYFDFFESNVTTIDLTMNLTYFNVTSLLPPLLGGTPGSPPIPGGATWTSIFFEDFEGSGGTSPLIEEGGCACPDEVNFDSVGGDPVNHWDFANADPVNGDYADADGTLGYPLTENLFGVYTILDILRVEFEFYIDATLGKTDTIITIEDTALIQYIKIDYSIGTPGFLTLSETGTGVSAIDITTTGAWHHFAIEINLVVWTFQILIDDVVILMDDMAYPPIIIAPTSFDYSVVFIGPSGFDQFLRYSIDEVKMSILTSGAYTIFSEDHDVGPDGNPVTAVPGNSQWDAVTTVTSPPFAESTVDFSTIAISGFSAEIIDSGVVSTNPGISKTFVNTVVGMGPNNGIYELSVEFRIDSLPSGGVLEITNLVQVSDISLLPFVDLGIWWDGVSPTYNVEEVIVGPIGTISPVTWYDFTVQMDFGSGTMSGIVFEITDPTNNFTYGPVPMFGSYLYQLQIRALSSAPGQIIYIDEVVISDITLGPSGPGSPGTPGIPGTRPYKYWNSSGTDINTNFFSVQNHSGHFEYGNLTTGDYAWVNGELSMTQVNFTGGEGRVDFDTWEFNGGSYTSQVANIFINYSNLIDVTFNVSGGTFIGQEFNMFGGLFSAFGVNMSGVNMNFFDLSALLLFNAFLELNSSTNVTDYVFVDSTLVVSTNMSIASLTAIDSTIIGENVTFDGSINAIGSTLNATDRVNFNGAIGTAGLNINVTRMFIDLSILNFTGGNIELDGLELINSDITFFGGTLLGNDMFIDPSYLNIIDMVWESEDITLVDTNVTIENSEVAVTYWSMSGGSINVTDCDCYFGVFFSEGTDVLFNASTTAINNYSSYAPGPGFSTVTTLVDGNLTSLFSGHTLGRDASGFAYYVYTKLLDDLTLFGNNSRELWIAKSNQPYEVNVNNFTHTVLVGFGGIIYDNTFAAPNEIWVRGDPVLKVTNDVLSNAPGGVYLMFAIGNDTALNHDVLFAYSTGDVSNPAAWGGDISLGGGAMSLMDPLVVFAGPFIADYDFAITKNGSVAAFVAHIDDIPNAGYSKYFFSEPGLVGWTISDSTYSWLQLGWGGGGYYTNMKVESVIDEKVAIVATHTLNGQRGGIIDFSNLTDDGCYSYWMTDLDFTNGRWEGIYDPASPGGCLDESFLIDSIGHLEDDLGAPKTEQFYDVVYNWKTEVVEYSSDTDAFSIVRMNEFGDIYRIEIVSGLTNTTQITNYFTSAIVAQTSEFGLEPAFRNISVSEFTYGSNNRGVIPIMYEPALWGRGTSVFANIVVSPYMELVEGSLDMNGVNFDLDNLWLSTEGTIDNTVFNQTEIQVLRHNTDFTNVVFGDVSPERFWVIQPGSSASISGGTGNFSSIYSINNGVLDLLGGFDLDTTSVIVDNATLTTDGITMASDYMNLTLATVTLANSGTLSTIINITESSLTLNNNMVLQLVDLYTLNSTLIVTDSTLTISTYLNLVGSSFEMNGIFLVATLNADSFNAVETDIDWTNFSSSVNVNLNHSAITNGTHIIGDVTVTVTEEFETYNADWTITDTTFRADVFLLDTSSLTSTDSDFILFRLNAQNSLAGFAGGSIEINITQKNATLIDSSMTMLCSIASCGLGFNVVDVNGDDYTITVTNTGSGVSNNFEFFGGALRNFTTATIEGFDVTSFIGFVIDFDATVENFGYIYAKDHVNVILRNSDFINGLGMVHTTNPTTDDLLLVVELNNIDNVLQPLWLDQVTFNTGFGSPLFDKNNVNDTTRPVYVTGSTYTTFSMDLNNITNTTEAFYALDNTGLFEFTSNDLTAQRMSNGSNDRIDIVTNTFEVDYVLNPFDYADGGAVRISFLSNEYITINDAVLLLDSNADYTINFNNEDFGNNQVVRTITAPQTVYAFNFIDSNNGTMDVRINGDVSFTRTDNLDLTGNYTTITTMEEYSNGTIDLYEITSTMIMNTGSTPFMIYNSFITVTNILNDGVISVEHDLRSTVFNVDLFDIQNGFWNSLTSTFNTTDMDFTGMDTISDTGSVFNLADGSIVVLDDITTFEGTTFDGSGYYINFTVDQVVNINFNLVNFYNMSELNVEVTDLNLGLAWLNITNSLFDNMSGGIGTYNNTHTYIYNTAFNNSKAFDNSRLLTAGHDSSFWFDLNTITNSSGLTLRLQGFTNTTLLPNSMGIFVTNNQFENVQNILRNRDSKVYLGIVSNIGNNTGYLFDGDEENGTVIGGNTFTNVSTTNFITFSSPTYNDGIENYLYDNNVKGTMTRFLYWQVVGTDFFQYFNISDNDVDGADYFIQTASSSTQYLVLSIDNNTFVNGQHFFSTSTDLHNQGLVTVENNTVNIAGYLLDISVMNITATYNILTNASGMIRVNGGGNNSIQQKYTIESHDNTYTWITEAWLYVAGYGNQIMYINNESLDGFDICRSDPGLDPASWINLLIIDNVTSSGVCDIQANANVVVRSSAVNLTVNGTEKAYQSWAGAGTGWRTTPGVETLILWHGTYDDVFINVINLIVDNVTIVITNSYIEADNWDMRTSDWTSNDNEYYLCDVFFLNVRATFTNDVMTFRDGCLWQMTSNMIFGGAFTDLFDTTVKPLANDPDEVYDIDLSTNGNSLRFGIYDTSNVWVTGKLESFAIFGGHPGIKVFDLGGGSPTMNIGNLTHLSTLGQFFNVHVNGATVIIDTLDVRHTILDSVDSTWTFGPNVHSINGVPGASSWQSLTDTIIFDDPTCVGSFDLIGQFYPRNITMTTTCPTDYFVMFDLDQSLFIMDDAWIYGISLEIEIDVFPLGMIFDNVKWDHVIGVLGTGIDDLEILNSVCDGDTIYGSWCLNIYSFASVNIHDNVFENASEIYIYDSTDVQINNNDWHYSALKVGTGTSGTSVEIQYNDWVGGGGYMTVFFDDALPSQVYVHNNTGTDLTSTGFINLGGNMNDGHIENNTVTDSTNMVFVWIVSDGLSDINIHHNSITDLDCVIAGGDSSYGNFVNNKIYSNTIDTVEFFSNKAVLEFEAWDNDIHVDYVEYTSNDNIYDHIYHDNIYSIIHNQVLWMDGWTNGGTVSFIDEDFSIFDICTSTNPTINLNVNLVFDGSSGSGVCSLEIERGVIELIDYNFDSWGLGDFNGGDNSVTNLYNGVIAEITNPFAGTGMDVKVYGTTTTNSGAWNVNSLQVEDGGYFNGSLMTLNIDASLGSTVSGEFNLDNSTVTDFGSANMVGPLYLSDVGMSFIDSFTTFGQVYLIDTNILTFGGDISFLGDTIIESNSYLETMATDIRFEGTLNFMDSNIVSVDDLWLGDITLMNISRASIEIGSVLSLLNADVDNSTLIIYALGELELEDVRIYDSDIVGADVDESANGGIEVYRTNITGILSWATFSAGDFTFVDNHVEGMNGLNLRGVNIIVTGNFFGNSTDAFDTLIIYDDTPNSVEFNNNTFYQLAGGAMGIYTTGTPHVIKDVYAYNVSGTVFYMPLGGSVSFENITLEGTFNANVFDLTNTVGVDITLLTANIDLVDDSFLTGTNQGAFSLAYSDITIATLNGHVLELGVVDTVSINNVDVVVTGYSSLGEAIVNSEEIFTSASITNSNFTGVKTNGLRGVEFVTTIGIPTLDTVKVENFSYGIFIASEISLDGVEAIDNTYGIYYLDEQSFDVTNTTATTNFWDLSFVDGYYSGVRIDEDGNNFATFYLSNATINFSQTNVNIEKLWAYNGVVEAFNTLTVNQEWHMNYGETSGNNLYINGSSTFVMEDGDLWIDGNVTINPTGTYYLNNSNIYFDNDFPSENSLLLYGKLYSTGSVITALNHNYPWSFIAKSGSLARLNDTTIEFLDNNTGSSFGMQIKTTADVELHNTTVRYSQRGIYAMATTYLLINNSHFYGLGTGLYVVSSTVDLIDTTMNDTNKAVWAINSVVNVDGGEYFNNNYSFYFSNSNGEIRGANVHDNAKAGAYMTSNSAPSINGSTFEDNYIGIETHLGSTPDIEYNLIIQNTHAGIKAYGNSQPIVRYNVINYAAGSYGVWGAGDNNISARFNNWRGNQLPTYESQIANDPPKDCKGDVNCADPLTPVVAGVYIDLDLDTDEEFLYVFTGSGAIDWAWDFDNGDVMSGSANVYYTYDTPGTYMVTITAYDGIGGSDSTTFEVVVTNLPIPVEPPEEQTIWGFLATFVMLLVPLGIVIYLSRNWFAEMTMYDRKGGRL